MANYKGSRTATGNFVVQATKKLFLDGEGDTYIHEVSANLLEFVVGGQVMLQISNNAILVPAAVELNLDGGADNTYMRETSSNVIDFTLGNTLTFKLGKDKIGFYGTTEIVQQTGVAVTEAGIHAALVNLGLITA